jgi:hypothetical protein
VLSSGELSLPTVTLLKRLGADEYYQREPEEVLSVLHDLFISSSKRESLEAPSASSMYVWMSAISSGALDG